MLNLNGISVEFDITSPFDVQRYKRAGENMEAAAQQLSSPALDPDDPKFLDAYIDMLNGELRIFGNFIDEVFGDGIAAQLLGTNPSLNKVAEINDALEVALETQGRDFGVKLQKYKPNRAARRTRK